MVQLKAKGSNRYVEANLPANVGVASAEVVLASLRNAVDGVLALTSSGDHSKAVLKQVVDLRQILAKVSAEAKDMATMVQVIERRLMEL